MRVCLLFCLLRSRPKSRAASKLQGGASRLTAARGVEVTQPSCKGGAPRSASVGLRGAASSAWPLAGRCGPSYSACLPSYSGAQAGAVCLRLFLRVLCVCVFCFLRVLCVCFVFCVWCGLCVVLVLFYLCLGVFVRFACFGVLVEMSLFVGWLLWFGVVLLCFVWLGLVWWGSFLSLFVRSFVRSSVCVCVFLFCRSVRFGLARFGSVRFGSVRFGLSACWTVFLFVCLSVCWHPER